MGCSVVNPRKNFYSLFTLPPALNRTTEFRFSNDWRTGGQGSLKSTPWPLRSLPHPPLHRLHRSAAAGGGDVGRRTVCLNPRPRAAPPSHPRPPPPSESRNEPIRITARVASAAPPPPSSSPAAAASSPSWWRLLTLATGGRGCSSPVRPRLAQMRFGVCAARPTCTRLHRGDAPRLSWMERILYTYTDWTWNAKADRTDMDMAADRTDSDGQAEADRKKAD